MNHQENIQIHQSCPTYIVVQLVHQERSLPYHLFATAEIVYGKFDRTQSDQAYLSSGLQSEAPKGCLQGPVDFHATDDRLVDFWRALGLFLKEFPNSHL